MPPADDTALARFHGDSSNAFLSVYVVAAVPGDGAAAFDCSNPALRSNHAHATCWT